MESTRAFTREIGQSFGVVSLMKRDRKRECERMIGRALCSLLAWTCLSVGIVAAQDVVEPSFEITEEENFTGVRVRNAEILGRVFVVGEREEEDEYPAEDVRVRVTEQENNEVLSETRTNADGRFELPQFDVGTYWLYIGKLRLELRVIEDPEMVAELPKIIIAVIPKEMAL